MLGISFRIRTMDESVHWGWSAFPAQLGSISDVPEPG